MIKLTERQMKNYQEKVRYTELVTDGLPSPCWLWTGAVSKASGFGRFRAGNKVFLAHRVIYATTYGSIPDGHFIVQECQNRLCCNPKHLKCVPRASRLPQGQDVRGAKLTEEIVRTIRRTLTPEAPRGTASKLARQYKVGLQTILNVASLKSWRHVE